MHRFNESSFRPRADCLALQAVPDLSSLGPVGDRRSGTTAEDRPCSPWRQTLRHGVRVMPGRFGCRPRACSPVPRPHRTSAQYQARRSLGSGRTGWPFSCVRVTPASADHRSPPREDDGSRPFFRRCVARTRAALTSAGVGSDNGGSRANGSNGGWGVPKAIGPAPAVSLFRRDMPNGITRVVNEVAP